MRCSPTSGWRASPAVGALVRCAISHPNRRAAKRSMGAPTYTRWRWCCPKRQRGSRPTIATLNAPPGRPAWASSPISPAASRDRPRCCAGALGQPRRPLRRRRRDARGVRGAARSRAGCASGGTRRDHRALGVAAGPEIGDHLAARRTPRARRRSAFPDALGLGAGRWRSSPVVAGIARAVCARRGGRTPPVVARASRAAPAPTPASAPASTPAPTPAPTPPPNRRRKVQPATATTGYCRRRRPTPPRVLARATSSRDAGCRPAHEAPATLDVNATPWAHVRVDGAPRGETPLSASC